ncbi:hypothetical protein ACUOH2_03085 [Escherichia coli]
MSGDKIKCDKLGLLRIRMGTRVKSQEVRYLYSEYFADDTSLCQMKLTSFSITTFFQKQEIGYQEAGCYDKASCFLSEERF